MKLIHIILLACIFFSVSANEAAMPGFDEMDYFNRELIVNSKISEIRLTISTSKMSNVATENPHSCIIFTTVFDKKGNLIRYDLNRVNSYNYYSYDDLGKLSDWGFEDKSNGEITSLAEAYKEDGEGDYNKNHAETEKFLKNSVNLKTDYRKKAVRVFFDPCYNIDSTYEVIHKDTGALPREAIAKRVLIIDKNILKNIISPNSLFITYDYIFY